MLWLKFNIYSLLLTLIALSILIVFCKTPFFYLTWWSYFLLLPVLFLILKAIDIFERFPQKKRIYHDLLKKSESHYDQRYSIPYMGTACMRHVVFWTLVDLGKRHEYHAIKQRYGRYVQENLMKQNVSIPFGRPKVVDIVMVQHEMKFVAQTQPSENKGKQYEM